MNLAQIRKQYPQYANIPDAKLAEGLRQKFYPQIDPNTFNQKIGFKPSGMDAALADARSNVMRNNAGTGAVGRTIRAAGQGATFGFGDELNGGINYLTTALANATGHGRGYSAAQGAQAATQATREDMGQFHNAHPLLDTGAQIAGGLATPGVGVAGNFVRGGTGLASVAARSALAGGALGAAAGAGNAQGGLLSRLKGASTGALAGAATGAVVPVAAVGAAGLANKVAAPVVNTVVRAANKASGGTLLNASRTASQRLTAAMQKDGLTPDMIRQAQTDWLQTGGVKPATMDLIAKASPTNGQNTMGLLRGAAMKGTARGVAATNAQDIATNLQDNAIARTTALTPDARPAQQVQDSIAALRSAQAEADYAGPYQTQVPLDKTSLGAMLDGPGQAAVKSALKTSVIRQNEAQSAELRSLLGASEPLDMSSDAIAQRAASQGFTEQVYHGTPSQQPINAFRPQSNGGQYGPGVYTTTDPVLASQYAGDSGAVYPLRVRPQNQIQADIFRNPAADLSDQEVADLARGQNANGVTVNMPDQKWFVMHDSNDIKSAFDPFFPDGYKTPPQTVSGAALDRTRIEMRNMGDAAASNPRTRAQAGGYYARASQIDDKLSGVPQLAEARARYADASGQMDAIDSGRTILNAAPSQYAASFTPKQAPSAGIGARQAMTDAIGAQPTGATGVLNRISGATNMGEKLAATYGNDAAQSYQGAIGDMTAQLRNARFIDSGSNSATAGRLADDDSIIGHVPLTAHGMLASGINKIRSMSTLTDAEREALVRTGVTQDPEALDELLSKFLPPRPRMTTLGASYATPAALALTDQGQNQ